MANFVFNGFLKGVAEGTDYFEDGCYVTVLNRAILAAEKGIESTSAFTDSYAQTSDNKYLSVKIDKSDIEYETESTDGSTSVKAPYANYTEEEHLTVTGAMGVLISTTSGNDGKNIAYFDFGAPVNVNNSDFRVLFSGGNTADPPVKGTMLKFKNS